MNVLRLAGWLRDRGVPVTMMSREGSPLDREAAKAGLPRETAAPHRKYFDFGAARRTAARLRSLGASTLVVFHRDDLDLASWTARFSGPGLRLLYQQNMQLTVSRRDPVHTFRYARYDAWLSPLEWLREEVLAKTRVRPERVRVIPLGIDDRLYRDDGALPAREEARRFFGVPPGGTLFGVIGRIEPGKGQGFVLKGVKKLRDAGHDARLLVVGDATIEPGKGRPAHDFPGQLREAVRELGLTGVVRLHPFIDDARPFYRAVDACVMATAHETYGMVTLESMASGTPVIGTDFGGTRELLGEGRFGMLYRAGDLDDFTGRATALIAGDYPPAMTAAARERALTRFSAGRQCDLLLELLRELHAAG